MTNQNKPSWILCYFAFALAGIFLFAGNQEAQGQIRPGNISTSATVELWLNADQGVTSDEDDNVTVWADQSGKGRNYTAATNWPTYNQETNLMNFHPSIDLTDNSAQKLIGPAHFLNAGNAYYVFYVSQQASSSSTFGTVYAFNSTRNNNYGWINGNPSFQTAGTGNTSTHQGNGRLYGINAVMIPNNTNTATRPQSYMNGVVNTTGPFTATALLTSAGAGVIGSRESTAAGALLFNGNIQEIIVLSGTVGNYLSNDDLNKMNSYLAVKYGIGLEYGDYVNSDLKPVWSRSTNTGYVTDVFGIGRDDASGLNQTQSCSANAGLITVFKGTLSGLNDNSNSNTALSDKEYLMLGSNGSLGKTPYVYPANTSFGVGTLSSKINFISKTIYKAQITTNGVSGNQTVSIQANDPDAQYILVSNVENFTKNSTRVYPLTDQIADGIDIHDGEYITFAGYEISPGGIGFGYATDLWVDGNHSTNTSWDNLAPANYSLEQFSTNPAPALRNTGYNFNKELYFGNATNTKLQTSAPYSDMALSNGYCVFVVSKPSGADEILLGFNNNSATGASYASMRWNANSAGFTSYWTTTGRAFTPTPSANQYGITTMNVANMNNGTLIMYLNGQNSNTAISTGANTSGPNSYSTGRILIGNGSNTTTNATGFGGSIQEIIVLRKNSLAGATDVIADADVTKVHSYLAVKYGITLTTGNYVSAGGGATVWDRSINGSYATNIFGIGRDDDSGLNQVQSRSANSDILTVYKGTLNELNDQSSTALNDKTYLMIGSNGSTGNTKLELPGGTPFATGFAIDSTINYISNTKYKAQITGGGSSGGNQTVNMKVNYVAARYVLVTPSTNSAFDKTYTRVYPIIENIATGVLINDGDLIAFAGYEGTPGGIDLSNGYTVDLWVDGNHSTDNSWKNIYGNANYSLQNLSTNPVPVLQNTGFNFNKELYFGNATNTKLQTSANYGDMATGRGYCVFVVSKPSGADEMLLGFNNNANNGGYASIRWNTGSLGFSSYWATTSRAFSPAPTQSQYGITTLNVANMNSGTLNMYLNGQSSVSTPALGSALNGNGPASFTTGSIMIGNGNILTSTTNGFAGSIQEIIVLRKSTADVMGAADVEKIHTYLAVKYGITLTAGNYVSAGGKTVWDRATNGDYAKNIFGIGRDDDSGLNQVQSRSAESDTLTVYKGTLNELNDYNSNALTDKTYVMLGSNGLFGNTSYVHPAGDNSFASGTIPNKINYRSKNIYKAQVLNEGSTAGSQTVNIKVNYTFAHDLIVSSDPAFPPASTYVYPITGGIATVTINNTYRYIAIAGFEATPGGLNLDGNGYTVDLWVDGNNSTNSSWTNLIPAPYSLVKYGTNTPVVQNSRFNFNKEIYFGNTTSSKLRTSTPYSLTTGNTYQAFIVSDASKVTTTPYSVLLTYNANATTSLVWNASTANAFSAYWSTTARTPNFAMPASARYGITTLNVVNSNNNPLDLYLNGAKYSTNLGTGAGSYNTPLMVANANTDALVGSTNPFNGAIQEIILVRSKDPSTNMILMPGDMIAKIQSYLAVKYGITLAGNYVNSNNDVVWDSIANSGYNSNIFGLGRDDDSGLYQKQAHSANDSTLTIYRGDEVTTLNNDNTGTLGDKQFLMIGRNVNEVSPAMTLANANIINDVNPFASGSLSNNLSNVQSPRYKVQLNNAASLTVKLTSPFDFFTNVIVSQNDAFNTKSTMKVYNVTDGVAEVVFDNTYKYFKFIGSREGPGGVGLGLLLWLQADVSASIDTLNFLPSSNEPTLAGLSSAYIKDPSSAISTVRYWKDIGRDLTWTYNPTGANIPNLRRPLMEPAIREMNYHPAVRFWGDGTTTSYLTNLSGITAPNPVTHTAFFIMNNNFNTGPRVYQMNFTPNPSIIAVGTVGNMYGIEKGTGTLHNGFGQGRYRGSAASTGNRDLFTVGSTTIASYYIDDRTNKGARFRFNGIENVGVNYTASGNGLTFGSTIGKGYNATRTVQGVVSEIIIYNGLIDEGITGIQDRDRIESYLALKYGVTLRPSPNTSTVDRFDYKFSDSEDVWPGQTGDSIFIKYYNRVSAVIRDDIASLNNTQSISTDVGSLLHLGVAGTVLDANGAGSVGDLNNLEAVAFGDNNATGFTTIQNDNECGDFDSRFNRIWLIHKRSENDRPVKMIVGAQNNADSPIGNDNNTIDYYSMLSGTYDVSMIVADSPEDIQNGTYRQVLPMTYINGVCQCTYTFSNENTYITFGTKENKSGCVPDADALFSGTKTFLWTQWTSAANRNPSTATPLTLPTTPFAPVDLGDNIQVLQTQVSYPANIRASIGYPRSGSIPVRGSLEVRRSQGDANQDVVVTITFNHPVIPEFSISGLDSYSNYAFEEVEVTGGCSGGGDSFMPMLSYATPRSPNTSFLIIGNKATVVRRGSVSGTNKNGMVNVRFLGSVSTVTIKYRITGRVPTSAMQRIYISPISFKTVPPPPPVNEDGLSFNKEVKMDSITTCDPADYSFSILNTNCEIMTANFSDTLPAKMKWDISSFVLDTTSENLNQSIEYKVLPGSSSYGEILQIDGLKISGSTTLVLNASAVLDASATDGDYDNHATIYYDRIIDDEPIPQVLESLDRYTLDPNTTFNATWQQRLTKVEVTESNSISSYKENSVITVTYRINNPNTDPVMGMFLDIDYNDEFAYVGGSFSATHAGGFGTYPPTLTTDQYNPLSIAGASDNSNGFTLLPGETVITFKLQAPDIDNLLYILDDQGFKTGNIADLDITYDLSSTSNDPCVIEAVTGLTGDKLIPYSLGLNHVISNKHVTSKVK